MPSDEHDWLALYRTQNVVPPAPTTNGGRTVMRRICEEAEITLDGEHDYLTPHGGRQGAGDVLYREDPVLAQTALRHRSIETAKDSYSYIEASETGAELATSSNQIIVEHRSLGSLRSFLRRCIHSEHSIDPFVVVA